MVSFKIKMFSWHFAGARCPGYSLHGQRAVLPQHIWRCHMLFASPYQLVGSQTTELPIMGDPLQVYQYNICHNSLYQLKMQSKLITVPFAGRKGSKAEMLRGAWEISSCKGICTKITGRILRDKQLPKVCWWGLSVELTGVRLPFAIELWWQLRACLPWIPLNIPDPVDLALFFRCLPMLCIMHECRRGGLNTATLPFHIALAWSWCVSCQSRWTWYKNWYQILEINGQTKN